MPIYEYRCDKNEHIFEAMHGVNDPAPAKCKFCDSPVSRLMSRSSFHLKGTGWYTTDYKKNSSAAAAKRSQSAAKPNPSACAGSPTACGCSGGKHKH